MAPVTVVAKRYIGSLQFEIHVVQIRHAGKQYTQWDKTNKERTSFKMVIFFVCLLPVRHLLSSIAVLYHVSDKMQKAYSCGLFLIADEYICGFLPDWFLGI